MGALRWGRPPLRPPGCEREMCLGVPGRITSRRDRNGLKMADVDFGGVMREVCLDYVPEAKVGDYCLVHVGFALSLISEAEAQETLSLLREISELEQKSSSS